MTLVSLACLQCLATAFLLVCWDFAPLIIFKSVCNPHNLRTFAPIVSAHPYCARLRAQIHVTSCIERACQVLKWTMIGQMAIAIALFGFNDLKRLVTPTFLFRNRFYLQLSPHCPKINKKSMWEV